MGAHGQAVAFRDEPSYAIALHGAAKLAAYGYAEPVVILFVFENVDYNKSAYKRRSFFICPFEFVVAFKLYDTHDALLVSQSLSASCSSSCYYLSAVLRVHSLSEAVLHRTVSLLGLKRSKHFYTLSFL